MPTFWGFGSSSEGPRTVAVCTACLFATTPGLVTSTTTNPVESADRNAMPTAFAHGPFPKACKSWCTDLQQLLCIEGPVQPSCTPISLIGVPDVL